MFVWRVWGGCLFDVGKLSEECGVGVSWVSG